MKEKKDFLPNIRDIAPIISWYENAAANKDPDATYHLAMCYETGRGVEASIEKAIDLYISAANLGNADAMYRLGELYEGELCVSQGAEELSVSWYKAAADFGHEGAKRRLEEIERESYLTLSPVKRAAALYRDGMAAMDASQADGPDVRKAARCFLHAAQIGHIDAMYEMGKLYDKGPDFPIDPEKAAKYYRDAAERGHVAAMTALGELYENGVGVDCSYEEALKWYQKGADVNNGDALVHLGYMYECGYAVETSFEKAKMLYEKGLRYGAGSAALQALFRLRMKRSGN